MNSTRFSPIKALAVSLALALGILVADLTCRPLVNSAEARTASDPAEQQISVIDVPVGTAVPIAEGRLSGEDIVALGVLVSGEEVNGVFGDEVTVVNSVLESDESIRADGVVVNVADSCTVASVCANGVLVSGEVVMSNGVLVSGELSVFNGGSSSSTATTASFRVVGGTVEGDNVRVEDGVIRGDNLRVVGASVRGSAIRLQGAGVVVTVTPIP